METPRHVYPSYLFCIRQQGLVACFLTLGSCLCCVFTIEIHFIWAHLSNLVKGILHMSTINLAKQNRLSVFVARVEKFQSSELYVFDPLILLLLANPKGITDSEYFNEVKHHSSIFISYFLGNCIRYHGKRETSKMYCAFT